MIKRLFALVFGLTILGSSASANTDYGGLLNSSEKRHQRNGGYNGGYCDYGSASSNGGWGWNPVTNSSCPPPSAQGYCDFSNAASNGGWGWNPVTSQSCR